jgi:hypothetical protein
VIDREGALVVTLTDGSTKPLGVVVGAKGEPGQDGKDGLGYDDLVVEQVDDQSFAVKAIRGDQVKTIGTPRFPVNVYRGTYKVGESYKRGESVTWDGSIWIAKEDTARSPQEFGTNKAWQLAVKKGKQGEPGKPGEKGPQGLKGDKGDRTSERW